MGGDSWGSHRGAAKEALIFQKWKINARKTSQRGKNEKRTKTDDACSAKWGENAVNKLTSISCAQAEAGGRRSLTSSGKRAIPIQMRGVREDHPPSSGASRGFRLTSPSNKKKNAETHEGIVTHSWRNGTPLRYALCEQRQNTRWMCHYILSRGARCNQHHQTTHDQGWPSTPLLGKRIALGLVSPLERQDACSAQLPGRSG